MPSPAQQVSVSVRGRSSKPEISIRQHRMSKRYLATPQSSHTGSLVDTPQKDHSLQSDSGLFVSPLTNILRRYLPKMNASDTPRRRQWSPMSAQTWMTRALALRICSHQIPWRRSLPLIMRHQLFVSLDPDHHKAMCLWLRRYQVVVVCRLASKSKTKSGLEIGRDKSGPGTTACEKGKEKKARSCGKRHLHCWILFQAHSLSQQYLCLSCGCSVCWIATLVFCNTNLKIWQVKDLDTLFFRTNLPRLYIHCGKFQVLILW